MRLRNLASSCLTRVAALPSCRLKRGLPWNAAARGPAVSQGAVGAALKGTNLLWLQITAASSLKVRAASILQATKEAVLVNGSDYWQRLGADILPS